MLRILLCLALSVFSARALAAPRVIVSVKPLAMLVQGVTEGVGEPELLIPALASPHAYSLKPSAVLNLQRADVVFWVGPPLESQLGANLARLPKNVRVEAVLNWPALKALALRSAHDHAGHPAQKDAHVWLDPQRAGVLVGQMAQILSELDVKNAARYQRNALAMQQRLTRLDARVSAQLEPHRARAFWVYHDGYQYFEKRYGLMLLGALNESPELPLKPQALLRLDKDPEARCLFLDAQYQHTSTARMLARRALTLVQLDPFGARQPSTYAGYEALIGNLAQGFEGCLAKASP